MNIPMTLMKKNSKNNSLNFYTINFNNLKIESKKMKKKWKNHKVIY